ncbi:hypothetical protein OsI_01830 [Oryza sativa Indica Group]|uniref:Uncharacterized protein n=1 Tax=Oryza sativa subsp. indica TaxID=39946 RepID=B8A7Y6_ORYSI|nr:hypothetical protein OsI_01830 [Oryza sativa Indica Group]
MPTAPIPSMSRGGAAHGRGSWKGMEMPQMEEREESANEKAEEIDGTLNNFFDAKVYSYTPSNFKLVDVCGLFGQRRDDEWEFKGGS